MTGSHLGNSGFLTIPKTAFLCSRQIPASAVLKCYDWAIEQREKGQCVVSGFQSKIEKDVLHYLIQGSQPLIIVLARGMKRRIEPELKQALDENRLLILSPFEENIRRVTAENAEKRNRMMMGIADEIVFGHISGDGMLSRLQKECKNKQIRIL
ncbi:MAG: DNA-binding protein [Syntrophaceae bacterium]|nr:DNA-binding protein [Syntrophaceae bacterium]